MIETCVHCESPNADIKLEYTFSLTCGDNSTDIKSYEIPICYECNSILIICEEKNDNISIHNEYLNEKVTSQDIKESIRVTVKNKIDKSN